MFVSLFVFVIVGVVGVVFWWLLQCEEVVWLLFVVVFVGIEVDGLGEVCIGFQKIFVGILFCLYVVLQVEVQDGFFVWYIEVFLVVLFDGIVVSGDVVCFWDWFDFVQVFWFFVEGNVFYLFFVGDVKFECFGL